MASPVRLSALVAVAFAGTAWAQLGAVTATAKGRQVTVTWTSTGGGNTEVAWGPMSVVSFAAYPFRLTSSANTTDHSVTIRRLAPGTWFVRGRTGALESLEQVVVVPSNEGTPLVDWAFDDQVNAALRLGSSWYVGGHFSWVGPTTGGGVPTTFDGGLFPHFPEVAGQVLAVEPDGTGGLLIGGLFSAVGGLRRDNLARLRGDLGVDPDFAPSFNGPVYAIHRGTSSVYVAGNFSRVNGQPRTFLAEVAFTGTLQSWAPTPFGMVFALDGAGSVIYAGGTFSAINGQNRVCVASIGVDGGVQPWNPLMGAGCTVKGLTATSTGVYVSGTFDTVAGVTQRGVALIDTAGALTPWRPALDGPFVSVNAVAQSGAGVFLGGTFTAVGSLARPGLALVDADGGQALPWNAPIDGGTIEGLAADGAQLFVVGSFPGRTASFSTVTAAPLSWSPRLNGLPRRILVVPSAVYVGGDFTGTLQTPRSQLASINAGTGALEPWSPTLSGGLFGPRVNAIAGAGSELFVGGAFAQVNGLPRGNAALISTTGTPSLLWDPVVNSEVRTMVLAPGGVLIGGGFDQVNGISRKLGAVLSRTNGQPVGFDPNLIPNGGVNGVAVDGLTSYWVGSFASSGATVRGRGAAFNLQTGALERWDPSVDTSVNAIHVMPIGVVLAGPFGFINGWGGLGVDRPTLAIVDRDAGAVVGPDFRMPASDIHTLTSAGTTLYVGGGALTDAGLVVAADVTTGLVRGFDVRGQSDLLLLTRAQGVYGFGLDCAGGRLAVAGNFHGVGLTAAGGLTALDIPCDAGEPGANLDAGTGADGGTAVDGGTAFDGGNGLDGGALDAGLVVDAGMASDGGAATDAGATSDGGDTDAGVDAGVSDGGGDVDAGAIDAGVFDAGSTTDAGAPADAGAAVDGGADAGVVTRMFVPTSCGCAEVDVLPAVLLALLVLTRRRR